MKRIPLPVMLSILGLALCSSQHVHSQTPVDLSAWGFEDYRVTTDPRSNWVVEPDGLTVVQSTNANPTVFFSDFEVTNTILEAIVQRPEPIGDDDYLGFAIGFEPDNLTGQSFLLIDWKKGNQYWNFGCGSVLARRGLAASRVFGVPTGGEFWGHLNLDAPCSDPDNGIVELQRATNLGTAGWVEGHAYVFRFEIQETVVRIFVDGVLELEIFDDFSGGRFGFYNFSQPNVMYQAFHVDATSSIRSLIGLVTALDLHHGIENSLVSKLDNALGLLDDNSGNNDHAAFNLIRAFVNTVEAQRGKHIPEFEADELILAARSILERQ